MYDQAFAEEIGRPIRLDGDGPRAIARRRLAFVVKKIEEMTWQDVVDFARTTGPWSDTRCVKSSS